MMKLSRLVPFLSLVIIFASCKNDLELNAPYKEIPSIYAVLDPSEPVQTIRINKVFLGEGDANAMAKVADSINYPAGELEVTLERFDAKGNKLKPSYKYDGTLTFTETVVEAQPGSFNTNQKVYVLDDSLFYSGQYRLTVRNKKTGNVFTAKANSISKIVPFSAQMSQGPYYPYPITPAPPPEKYIDYSVDNPKIPYDIKYFTNDSAFMYQLLLRYCFKEDLFNETRLTYVDYNAGTRISRDAQKFSNQTFLQHTFNGAGINASLGSTLSKFDNTIRGRKVEYLEYIVYCTSREYYDYLEYVKPSLSLNQNKPLYSNFDNSAALGIFTFRTHVGFKKQLANAYINAMAVSPSLCRYKLFDQYGTVPGCK